jgi:hypothetical protein
VQKNFHLAASAALVFLAVALRLGYAWRVGVPPHADLLIAGAACVLAVGAVAYRVGGPWAAAAASFIWAALPAAVVANTFLPPETYAALAGAASLYYFLKFREDQKLHSGLAAGLLAGVAVAFDSAYLTLAAFYLLWAAARAIRKGGPGARAFLWLGGFALVLAVAAVLEYLRVGEPFAHLRAALAATPDVYPEAKLLVKRLGADAAAMLFWDPLGFGFAGVVALAAAVYYVGARNGAARSLAAFFVLALAALNFATTTFRGYAPMPLEPTKWLAAALPAAVLAGAAAGELWSPDGALGRWAGSLGAAAVLAILFVNGNMPYAPASLALLGLASLATLALAGLARRGGERERRRCARAAAAIIILISILPVVILYS